MHPSALYLTIAAVFAKMSACSVAEVPKAMGVKQVVLLTVIAKHCNAAKFEVRCMLLQCPH